MKCIFQGPFSEVDIVYLILLYHLCNLQPPVKNRIEAYFIKIKEGADMKVLLY